MNVNVYDRFKNLTKTANNIVLTTHIVPDADGIGAEIALCLALKALGKNAICVNEEPLLERYKYLDAEDVVISHEDYQKRFSNSTIDLFIVADTNSLNRIGDRTKNLAHTAKEIVFVDHHPCAKEIMAIHCIDTSKAATGELAGELIRSMNVTLTKEMALPLYTAILIDTSSFRYPTVTANTHRLVGSLMDTGVAPPHAYNMIYGTKKLSYMKMLGIVLSTAQSTNDEKISWMILTEDLMKKHCVDSEDTHAFINHLLVLDNIKVAVMFREMGHQTKVSLRSIGDIDVGIMAQALGGGGHDHSAATIIEGTVNEVVTKTIDKLQAMLIQAEKAVKD